MISDTPTPTNSLEKTSAKNLEMNWRDTWPSSSKDFSQRFFWYLSWNCSLNFVLGYLQEFHLGVHSEFHLRSWNYQNIALDVSEMPPWDFIQSPFRGPGTPRVFLWIFQEFFTRFISYICSSWGTPQFFKGCRNHPKISFTSFPRQFFPGACLGISPGISPRNSFRVPSRPDPGTPESFSRDFSGISRCLTKILPG